MLKSFLRFERIGYSKFFFVFFYFFSVLMVILFSGLGNVLEPLVQGCKRKISLKLCGCRPIGFREVAILSLFVCLLFFFFVCFFLFSFFFFLLILFLPLKAIVFSGVEPFEQVWYRVIKLFVKRSLNSREKVNRKGMIRI